MKGLNLKGVGDILKQRADFIVNTAVIAGTVLSVIVFLFQMSSLSRIQRSVEKHSKMVAQMLEWKEKVGSRKGQVSMAGYLRKNQSLLSVLTPLARQLGLESESIQPGTPFDRGTYILQSVKFKFKGADFQKLMHFIFQIEHHGNIKMAINRLSIERNVKGTGVNAAIEVEAYQEK